MSDTAEHDLVVDELGAVAEELLRAFPDIAPEHVRAVVYAVYHRLAASATVTEHLIPLTLNRARAELTRNRPH